GIRDFHVTGVQTCALPISLPVPARRLLSYNKVARAQNSCLRLYLTGRGLSRLSCRGTACEQPHAVPVGGAVGGRKGCLRLTTDLRSVISPQRQAGGSHGKLRPGHGGLEGLPGQKRLQAGEDDVPLEFPL